jgi:hypothetical protein
MTPNPKTGLVTLPEVITSTLARKFGEISLYNQHADIELDIPMGHRTSRLLSHRVKTPHFTSTSRMASARPVGPTHKLSLDAGLARRSSPTTLRTPTPPSATTRTPPTSSTSGRTLSSLNLRSSRLSNRCHGQPPV